MEKLNSLSKDELIYLLIIKTDIISEYDILCAKHAAMFERYRQLCRKHISALRKRCMAYEKGDIDNMKVSYHQINQMRAEIQRTCEKLKKLECEMKQAASLPACN
jgi:hypothetical protein